MAKLYARAWLLALLAMLSMGLARVADDSYSGTVNIIEGQTRLMPYPGVSRVSIGHPDIANAQPTGPDEILLTGLKAGVTDLRIWKGSSQVRYLLKVVDNSWVVITIQEEN